MLFDTADKLELRDAQKWSVHKLFEAFKNNYRRVILVMPTGAGKRYLAVYLSQLGAENGRSVLFVTNRRILVGQMFREAGRFGVEHGVIMSNIESGNSNALVQIASVQTLGSRYLKPGMGALIGQGLPPANLIVIDEGHRDVDRYVELLKFYPDAKVVILTATPVGDQGRSLIPPYDFMVEGCLNSELIAQGLLLKTEVYAPSEPDIVGVKIEKGEYNQGQLGRAVKECTVFADVFNEWAPFADRKTVVFVPGVAYGNDLAEQFNRRLGSGQFIVVSAKTKDREDIFKRVVQGEAKGLISVDVLKEGFDCLDSETEILTAKGWKGLADRPGNGDLIWTLNMQTGESEMAPVIRSVVRAAEPSEKMLTIKSQHLDIRVTEGHEFHLKYADPHFGGRPSPNWITRSGKQMADRKSAYLLPISAEGLFEGIPLSDDELRLIAWFITDGGFTSNRTQIEINQSPKKFHEDIRSVLTNLGLNFKEYKRLPCKSGYKSTVPFYYRFNIPKGVRGPINGWGKYEAYLDKSISHLLMRMTRDQFRVFWDELMKGDGSVSTGQLICCEKVQADRLMQMAVTRGFAAICRTDKTKKGKLVYYVGLRDSRFIGSQPSDPRSSKITLTESVDGELVWCVTTRNKTIFTRRRGKVAILGNCPELSCGIDLQPNQQLRSYWQKVGRIKRAFGDQTAAIWLDFAGNYWRFPHPDDDPVWPTGDETTQSIIERQRNEEGERQPLRCPNQACKHSYKPTSSPPKCPKCGHVITGEPKRVVRMGNGKLKSVPAIAKKKREKSDAERKLTQWSSLLYGGMRTGRSLHACAAIYRHKTGEWPQANWPGVMPKDSLEWKRSVSDVLTPRELGMKCSFLKRDMNQ